MRQVGEYGGSRMVSYHAPPGSEGLRAVVVATGTSMLVGLIGMTGCGPSSPLRHAGGSNATRPGTVLSCGNSAGQQAGDPSSRPINGVESAALSGTSDPQSVDAVIPRGAHQYLVWKVFLGVAPTAVPYRTVGVVKPRSARLVYASPTAWAHLHGASLLAAGVTAVRLSACGHPQREPRRRWRPAGAPRRGSWYRCEARRPISHTLPCAPR